MERIIPAATANRKFSKLLRGVCKGQRYVITSYGVPVAKLVPADVEDRSRQSARTVLFERLYSQRPSNTRQNSRGWRRGASRPKYS